MINIIKYISFNSIRKYRRLIKENKLNFLGVAFGMIFFFFLSLDIFQEIDYSYYKFIPLIIFIYALIKLFQEIPTMSVSPQLIELKILKLYQLKLLVVIKSTVFSFLVFSFLINTEIYQQELVFKRLIVSLLINVIINIICFLQYQVKHRNLLKITMIVIIALTYYINSIILSSLLLIVVLFILLTRTYLKYDLILPYYESMGNISEALLSGDMDAMVMAQGAIAKSKIGSSLGLMEKNYSEKRLFYYSKELSRMLYYSKNWINLSLINFLVVFIAIMYTEKISINVGVFLGIFYLTDNILGLLNKSEARIKEEGFYLPFTISEIIKQKYLVHLLIIFIPLIIPGILLLKRINFLTLTISYLALPIKNILSSFGENKSQKYLSYLIDSMIFYICLMNIL